MKTSPLTILAVSLLVLALPSSALAGKQRGKRFGRENKDPGKVLKQYDTNRNQKIDGDEREALRKAFAGTGNAALKAFDTNRDGQLDDREIDAIKAKKRGEKGAAKKIKRKKTKVF